VADEGLRDGVDPVQRVPLQDGRPHDLPQLLRLHPPLQQQRPTRAPPLCPRRPLLGGVAAARLQQRRPRRLLHGTRAYVPELLARARSCHERLANRSVYRGRRRWRHVRRTFGRDADVSFAQGQLNILSILKDLMFDFFSSLILLKI
jgi:hypothetical protein